MRLLLRAWFLLALLPTAVAEPAADPQPSERRTYREVSGKSLSAHVFRPPEVDPGERRPAILLFHGGGWSAGAPEWTHASAARFASHGMVAVSVEYRLAAGEVTPIEALDDACAAFRWVRRTADELGVDPARVAAHGVSAGGQLAAMAGCGGCPAQPGDDRAGPSPNLLLLWSPALDLAADGWFGKLLRERGKPADYSPVEHVRKGTPPTNIVIGERDSLTPLSGARAYCDRLVASGGVCELIVYPGVGHLLTRNLASQEQDFDPDPVHRADGIEKQMQFLKVHGYLTERVAPAR